MNNIILRFFDDAHKLIITVLFISILISPLQTITAILICSFMQKRCGKKFAVLYSCIIICISCAYIFLCEYYLIDALFCFSNPLNYFISLDPYRIIVSTVSSILFIFTKDFLKTDTSTRMVDLEVKRQQHQIPFGQYNYSSRVNTLLICTTRSGKTTALANIIEHSLAGGEPVIVISGKNGARDKYSLCSQLKHMCSKHGRELKIISTSEYEDDRILYNPFKYASPTTVRDVLLSLFDFSETHYESAFSDWILAICTVIIISGDVISIPRILQLYDFSSFKAKVKDLFSEEILTEDELEEYLAMNRVADIAKDSKSRLRNLIRGDADEVLNTTYGYSVRDARIENAVILFDLDGLRYGDFSRDLGMLITCDIRDTIADEDDVETKKLIVMDELSIFFSDLVPTIYAQASGFGYQTVAGSQSFSDMDKVSSSLAEVMIENSHQFGFFLQHSAEDAERAAKIIGTRKIPEITKRINGASYDPAGSLKIVEEFRVHPNVVKNLSQREMILYNKTNNPDLTKIKWDFVS